MTLPQPLILLAKTVEWIILAVMLGLFFMVVSPLLPTRKYLASFAVITGSMEPHIPVGTLALVQETPMAEIKEGDVIAFAEPDNPKRTILHRVTQKTQGGTIYEFKTKGDNNPVPDNWTISAHQVKGKLVSQVPKLGFPIMFAQTPIGFALLVGGPALLLTILNIISIIQGIREWVSNRGKTQPAFAANPSNKT